MTVTALNTKDNVLVADMHLNFVREYFVKDIGVCDKLIDLFKTAKRLGFTGPGRTGNYQINKNIKDSEDFAVEALPGGHPEIPSPNDSGFNEVMKQFIEFIPRYYEDVDASWKQEIEFKYLPHFQHYNPGGGYHAWHCDATGETVNRHLVFLLYLNDVPGGGTEFRGHDYVCEAKKGKVLMFPANFCYPHRSQISQTHEKYILTGWATPVVRQR
jgi:2OG-Fe(II) oxygenase superfamily